MYAYMTCARYKQNVKLLFWKFVKDAGKTLTFFYQILHTISCEFPQNMNNENIFDVEHSRMLFKLQMT